MDPFSRKLFKNSGARQRLAQMGGIVASSPELASTVQRFQDGSLVSAEPEYVVIIPGLTDRRGMRVRASTLERLGQANPELLQQSQVIDAEIARQQGVNVGALRPGDAILTRRLMPAAPETTPMTVGPEPTNLPHTGPGMGVRHGSGASGPFASVGTPPTPAEAVGTPPTPAEAVGLADGTGGVVGAEPTILPHTGPGMGVRHASGASGPFASVGTPPTPAEESWLPWFMRMDPEAAPYEALERLVFTNRDPAEIRERRLAARAPLAPADEPEFDDEGDLLPPPPAREEPEPDPEPAPTAEPDAEPTPDPMAAAADDTAAELRRTLGLEEPDSPPRNRRERINQELDLIREVFGHRNRDEARERAMNLAMIGLAIAAGQSPNALTNIAQGALAGTQAMQRAQEAEREREDALRLRAYESVLAEEREDRQFGRQIQLAEFRAGLAPPAGTTGIATDPGNLFLTALDRVRNAGIETPVGMRLMEIEDEREREAFALERSLNDILTVSPTATDADRARLEEVARRVQARISLFRLTPQQGAALEEARRVLERNPANRAEIESRLRGAGIDPSLL